MANTVKKTKYFYPPRPGNGAGTFSDNLVGIQLVDGGGLTQANFEFTTGVVEKVNRTFGTGAYNAPVSLEDLGITNISQSQNIASQFRVYPNYDTSQVTNFSLYGSLSKRLSVSVTNIINNFPAALDVLYTNLDFTTGNTAMNISYDLVQDETYFEVDLTRVHNPLGIDYTVSATTNLSTMGIEVSKFRNLEETYLDYAIVVNGVEYKVNSFSPSNTINNGSIAFFVSGTPFGINTTTFDGNYQIRPNDYVVDKVFIETFDEVEQFLVNRLVNPIYTATFQVPTQDFSGQFYVKQQTVTWPLDGTWNLDIRSQLFDSYLNQLQIIAGDFDSFRTNLLSRFLTSDSIKEFDTLGRKVEKILQIYGRSFDQLKQYIDGLSFINSVNYTPKNDIPSELLTNLAQTLGWNTNFSPITNDDYLTSIFGNQQKTIYPGYTRAQTPTEVNYAFYRNLILNSSYLFKSKGTRRSVEFLLSLIGIPESILEFNEHVEVISNQIDIDYFNLQYSKISGGTYVDEVPVLDPTNTFSFRGITFTGFTTQPTFENVTLTRNDYPLDDKGFPKTPKQTDQMFFQKGAGWWEQTPEHTSPEELVFTTQVFTGQNTNIQTSLKKFSYGEEYLNEFRDLPFIDRGFNLTRIVDNNKSWTDIENGNRSVKDAKYDANYFINNEKLVLNIKNIDLFLNPSQGLVYDIWVQSVQNNYPFPSTGLTEYYPVPGGVDSTIINPKANEKTFFEFKNSFWQNMVNTRNRQYITDGKTGGYPTLQSVWWRYLAQKDTIGVQNNQYTYQKLIDFSKSINPLWSKLVEQMIPATTIWQTGTKYENSILQRQKFVYRRDRGCVNVTVEVPEGCVNCKKEGTPPQAINPIINVVTLNENINQEYVEISIYPWLNEVVGVSSFSDILYQTLNTELGSVGLSVSDCPGANSVKSSWFVDLRIDDEILIQEQFYSGLGISDVPKNEDWELGLFNFLPQIINYGLTYYLNDSRLKIVNLGTQPLFLNQNLHLNVGINIELTC